MKYKFALFIVTILALTFRLMGVDWDQGHHLHPDERFLTMVAERMEWTTDYLSTKTSTLNPHNIGYHFFVYGTYPIIFVKWLAQTVGMHDYSGITLVGRLVSALVDVGVLVLVVIITKRLWGIREALRSGFVYAIAVLPIQLSHYFATDPYAVFFMVLSVYFIILLVEKKKLVFAVLLGVSFGLALAAKISSIVLVPTLGLGFLFIIRHSWVRVMVWGLVSLFVGLLTLRLFMPYLFDGFGLNEKVLANWKELKSYDNPQGYFPPATMWINSIDYIFPLENMALWGLGLPLFVLALASLGMIPKSRDKRVWLIGLAVFSIVIYQGGQFAKPMRYFYIVYPMLAILIGRLLTLFSKPLYAVAVALCLVWPISFVNIYLAQHPRVVASKWIYQNIPYGANISCEHWDDCLPLNIAGTPGNSAYRGVELPMYYPDTPQKWQEIGNKLSTLDYLILSSNRVYGSTSSVPEKFPINTKFYQLLFAEKLGFEKVVEFTNRPGFEFPSDSCLTPPGTRYGIVAKLSGCRGLRIVDDYADETFTVYDHPKVTIFRKTEVVDYQRLLLQ